MLAELDALMSQKQAPKEDLEEYLMDVHTRCRLLKRSPEQLFEYTLQGLQPHIKRQVLGQLASTIKNIRRIGKLCNTCAQYCGDLQHCLTKTRQCY